MSNDRDPRLDRWLQLALTAFVGVACAVSVFVFQDLKGSVDILTEEVVGLKVEMAVVNERSAEIIEIRTHIHALRTSIESHIHIPAHELAHELIKINQREIELLKERVK